MKKIRVLHILNELNTGGAEKIVVDYFENINRSSFQWDFIITKYDDKNKKGILEEKVERLGGKIYRVTRKRKNYLKNLFEINQIIKNGKYDIVHSHLDELSAIYLFFAKIHRVPKRICHSHLAEAKRGKIVEILCKIYKMLLSRVITEKFACGKKAAEALWGSDKDVYIMNNAIDINKFKYKSDIREKIRKKMEIDGKFVIGSVGRFSYQKNSLFLIDIFKDILDINSEAILILVGTGPDEELVRKKVQDNDLESKVYFLGRRTDINELMMAMDVFLLPSRFEGLPIVLVEAQCTGLSCLVSNTITKEIKINPNINYISINDGTTLWCDALKNDVYKIDRENAYKKIQTSGYDIKKESEKIEKKYVDLVKNI